MCFHCLNFHNQRLATLALQFQNNEDGTAKAPTEILNTYDELKANVENLLRILLVTPFTRVDGVRVPSYTCAKTKVYFRAGALESLEADLFEYVYPCY